MTRLDQVKDVGFRLVPRLHKVLLDASKGRALGSVYGMPVVELHTTGRKTGQRRTTMLTAPLISEDRVVVVASKGGDDRNPTWLLNLEANPDVELTAAGKTRAYRARIANADEKAELWPQIVAAYKGYADYQTRTSRDIPVVILEP